MGKKVSGSAWEGPSGQGRWGRLSGTVSFPGRRHLSAFPGPPSLRGLLEPQPELAEEKSLWSFQACLWGPLQLGPCPFPSTVCPRRAPSLWPGAPPDRMPEVEADVSAGPSPAPSACFSSVLSRGRLCRSVLFQHWSERTMSQPWGTSLRNKPLAGNPQGLRLLFWEPRKAVHNAFCYLPEHSILLFP